MELPSTLAHTVILIMELAALVSGEARGMTAEGQQAIAHVALNRLEAGYGWDGWNGFDEPTSESVMNAYLAVKRDHDPTGGALYALSRNDMRYLGFEKADIVIENPENGQALYLLYEWPRKGE